MNDAAAVIPQAVSDDERDDALPSSARHGIRPPAPTQTAPSVRATADASAAADFDALRRDFLVGSARSLSVSHVRSAHDRHRLVDGLGLALAPLREMRAAIGRVRAFHAALAAVVARDVARAEATTTRHDFDVHPDSAYTERSTRYATTVGEVVDMFMASVAHSEEVDGGEYGWRSIIIRTR